MYRKIKMIYDTHTIDQICKSNQYYVYILFNGPVAFYVGKGIDDRIYSHEQKIINPSYKKDFGLTKDYNPRKTRKIKKILREGKSIIYCIESVWDNEHDALVREVDLIKHYGRKGIDPNGTLTNITEGGIGGNIWATLDIEKQNEIRAKIRGRKVSDETKEKIRVASTGRKHTPDAKRKISEAKKGNKNPNYGISQKVESNIKRSERLKGRTPWNKNKTCENISNKMKELVENGCHPSMKLKKTFKIISPDGIIHEGSGVDKYLTEHKLSHRLRYLINGTIDEYKGWRRG